MDAEERVLLSEKLSENLKKLFIHLTIGNKIIGVFAPIGMEPLWVLEGRQNELAFPARGSEEEMIFKKCHQSKLVPKKEFGVGIPAPEGLTVIPEVILLPGLAFSRKGQRLGRGGGFYDRYCKDYGGLTIGLCWERQVVDSIPCEEHDRNVDFVVTEKSLYHRGDQLHFLRRE